MPASLGIVNVEVGYPRLTLPILSLFSSYFNNLNYTLIIGKRSKLIRY
jgi:hypothetical protein